MTFQCDGAKVFAQYDPPHILKNIRNALKKNDVLFGDDGKVPYNICHQVIFH